MEVVKYCVKYDCYVVMYVDDIVILMIKFISYINVKWGVWICV